MNALKSLEFAGTRALKRVPFLYSTATKGVGLFDSASLAINEWRSKPLLLVYQQGRVASTSVYEALARAQSGLSVFHLHTLSAQRADEVAARSKESGTRLDRNIILAKKVARSLDRRRQRGGLAQPFKVVTIFREPIGIMLSLKMMDAQQSFADISAMGTLPSPQDALEHVKASLERDDPSGWAIGNWFEEVLQEELSIDVFSTPFDHKNGFTLIGNNEFDLVLLKYEMLKTSLTPAITALLGQEPPGLELRYSNVHRNDPFDEIHAYIKENLRLSQEFCERAYSTRFMQHFYSDEEREQLCLRWTCGPSGGPRKAGH